MLGLFGIKPQRDRIPLGPDHHDAWNGLDVYGPLARTVADAAVFLDATATRSRRGDSRRRSAAAGAAARRRVVQAAARLARALGAEQRGAVEGTAELLRSLGHEVFEREVDLPFTLTLNVCFVTSRGSSRTSRRCRAPSVSSATPGGSPRSVAASGRLAREGAA